jgi:hypothetical protein
MARLEVMLLQPEFEDAPHSKVTEARFVSLARSWGVTRQCAHLVNKLRHLHLLVSKFTFTSI